MRKKKALRTCVIILIFMIAFFSGAGIGMKLSIHANRPITVMSHEATVVHTAAADDKKDIINEKKAYIKDSESRYKSRTSAVQDSGKINYQPQDNTSVNDSNILFKGVPVLMYHSIAYEKNNDLRVPKELFEQEMKYIKDNGYNTMTLDALYDCIKNNKPAPPKSVVITFDDGYEDNYTNAYPVLKEYGLHATIFVIANTVDKNNSYLTSSQLKEMQQNGIDIESHTANHDDLSLLSYEKQVRTLSVSKQFLESLLGKKVRYVALPCGKYNSYTEKAATDAGYVMAFLTAPGKAQTKQGLFKLHRVRVSSTTTLLGFKYLIS